MILNYIWICFFLIAFVTVLFRSLLTGDLTLINGIVGSTFDNAKTAFEISLGLTGVLSLWLGIMKVGEMGGVVDRLARWASPLFQRLFPDIPKGHPATGAIFMNLSANMLGLDNAATPLGLKAMKELQQLNPHKETASNPMIMFLVINTSSLTILPISIMAYRAQMGAANPADIFLPILIATFASTFVGILAVCLRQKIRILDPVILGTFGTLIGLILLLLFLTRQLSQEELTLYSGFFSNFFLFTIIICFILAGMRKKINVYEAFIEGAKDGFQTAIGIIPYLMAILVSIGVFRASGAMDVVIQGIASLLQWIGIDDAFVPALPTAFMKPLSGSGARGMMIDAMQTYGVDSFVGRLSCIIQGSTDTTLFILAVYFGSVGIQKTRYAASCGLLADLAGIIAAIFVGYLFFFNPA